MTDPSKLTAETRIAINAFRQVERLNRMLERAETGLADAVSHVPPHELERYVEITEKMRGN